MMFIVFMAVLETFIIFGFGAFAWKKGMLLPGDLDRLSRLTLDFFFPMLTFTTITRNFNRDQLDELWLMPLLGFGLMAFGMVAGLFFKRLMRNRTPERERTFHHICTINNYVFLPLIVLQNIGNERHVALLLIMNVGSTVGFWTLGVMTLTGGGGGIGKSIRSIWSINLLAVIAALAVAFCGIPVPAVLDRAMSAMGMMSVPFMLLLIGVALTQNYRSILHHKIDIGYLAIIRLAVIPVLFGLFLKLLPLDADIFLVLLVVVLMPAASSSVLVARRYGGSDEFAAQAIIVTTLLSLISIPLLMRLLY
ncbi:MAG: AEC family transporter [Victivallaceae bacterium]